MQRYPPALFRIWCNNVVRYTPIYVRVEGAWRQISFIRTWDQLNETDFEKLDEYAETLWRIHFDGDALVEVSVVRLFVLSLNAPVSWWEGRDRSNPETYLYVETCPNGAPKSFPGIDSLITIPPQR